MCDGRAIPRDRWDLSSDILGATRGVKAARPVLAKDAPNHREGVTDCWGKDTVGLERYENDTTTSISIENRNAVELLVIFTLTG